MHYYQFNIGDYASHTRGLSLYEDLAYRRLLDEYYLSERPLNSGVASVARQIGMREQEKEVEFVLSCFFFLTDKGWIHTRADKEIEHYHSKIEQASKAGRASAERRLNARSTDVQPTNNQEPITNNHKPNNKTTAVVMPEGISQSVWDEFIAHRKAKKAKVTQLVIEGIGKEASKAGWSLEEALKETIVRNWQSFKADWVQPKQASNIGFIGKHDVAHMTTPTPPNHDAALRKIEEDRKKAVPMPAEIRAKIQEALKGKVA